MPEPCKARDAHFLPVDFKAGEGGFFYRVGGENGLRDLKEVVELRAQRCGEVGSAAISFSAGAERR